MELKCSEAWKHAVPHRTFSLLPAGIRHVAYECACRFGTRDHSASNVPAFRCTVLAVAALLGVHTCSDFRVPSASVLQNMQNSTETRWYQQQQHFVLIMITL